jgi:hypothetical protein
VGAVEEAMNADRMTLDEAWADAEAAMTIQYRSALGDLISRKRYDLSVHRRYASRLDADGNEQYQYEARAALPGIDFISAHGSTHAAALRALTEKLRKSAQRMQEAIG